MYLQELSFNNVPSHGSLTSRSEITSPGPFLFLKKFLKCHEVAKVYSSSPAVITLLLDCANARGGRGSGGRGRGKAKSGGYVPGGRYVSYAGAVGVNHTVSGMARYRARFAGIDNYDESK